MLEKPLLTGGNVRRGGLSCCYCCDSKRATLIVTVIDMLLAIILMILLTISKTDPKITELNQEEIDHIQKYYVLSMVSQGIGLGFNIATIVGALLYNRRLIILGIVWTIIGVVLTFIYGAGLARATDYPISAFLMFAWVSSTFMFGLCWYIFSSLYISIQTQKQPIIWAFIQIYPEIIFIHEVNQGIMSALTYDREEHCGLCSCKICLR